MLIGIRTNRPEYRNDIAEEIRLFTGLVEIAFLEADETADLVFDIEMTSGPDGLYTIASSAGAARDEATFTVPETGRLAIKKLEKRNIKLAAYRLLQQLYPDVETPWGSLTGIRPTKLFRELAAESGEAEARRAFCEVFSVTPEKIALAETISGVQRPYLADVQTKDIDVYIGIPFCKTRCLYCSFASEVLGRGEMLSGYLDALKQDIANGAALVREGGYRLRAMYIGGGTPTVLTAEQLDDLLTFAFSAYGGYGRECTVEAGRPDTITGEKLRTIKRLGVARISINPQTMHDETLARVGRAHTAAEIVAAYHMAREVGFASINMDVIAGLPGETVVDMAETCQQLELLDPDNLTVHALAIKRSSLLKKQLAAYPLPSAADAERMIREGYASALRMGMRPYYMYRQKYMSGNLENVGYAKPGSECVYNIDMMEETVSILSHGAGSMTKRVFGGEGRIERLPSPKDVPTYLKKLPQLLTDKRRFFLD